MATRSAFAVGEPSKVQPQDEWRRALRATRAARDVAHLGPSSAARAAVAELADATVRTRAAVASLLASQGAKNEFRTDLKTFWRELAAGDEFARDMAAQARPRVQVRRPRRGRDGRRDALPVEAARAVPLLELLARHGIDCRPAGREYLGRCPFRKHARAHLYVNPQKNVWKCWPCGIGGDGIDFVQRLRGLDFAAAVREMAA